jgi:MFS family permease
MKRRWVIVALIFFGIVISYVDRGNLSIAAPSIMRDFGIAPGAMGLLLSAFFWTYGAFQIPAGAFLDRVGIRRGYAVGFLVWSIASASIAVSRGTGDVIGLRLVLGMAESIGPLASLAFIRNHFQGKDQGLPTSIYIAGQSIGPALGALAGTMLLDRFGWRLMFAVTGLGALIWLPCWLLAAPADEARPVRVEVMGTRAWTWQSLIRSRGFWALSLCILLASYYWYFVLTWVPTYLVVARGFSARGFDRPFHRGGDEFVGRILGGSTGAKGGSFSYPCAVRGGGVFGDGCDPAASGAAGSGVDCSCVHVFDVRDGDGERELLGYRTACFAGEYDRADHWFSEHVVAGCGRGGSAGDGMDTGAGKAFRPGDFGGGDMPCFGRRVFAGGRE